MKALTKTQKNEVITNMRKNLASDENYSCKQIIKFELNKLFLNQMHDSNEKQERLEEFQVIMDQLLIEA
jgi:hypothetical protein